MNAKPPEPTKTGAGLNRGRSRQDYSTPPDLRAAIEKRFGFPELDLACDLKNGNQFGAKGLFHEHGDSLKLDWSANIVGGRDSFGWLNPPFADITPWAKKCALHGSKGTKVLLLVPAAVGSRWFQNYVLRYAMSLALIGRPSFDGVNGYPKDCLLAMFGWGFSGFDVWDWRRDVKREEPDS